jgi:type VI secretion system secreted protein VgrG
VLCDSPSAHVPAPGRETVKLRPDLVNGRGYAEALWTWREHAVTNGEERVLLQSFDYQTTRTRSARADLGEPTPADDQLLHEFVGDFVDEELGRHWAQVKLEAAHARRRHYTGDGDMIGLACGGCFKLDSSDAFKRGTDFTITALRYDMWAEPLRSGNEHEARRVAVEAIPADTNFRSPVATPLPFAGPETAIVVKGGADDSHADELGRVRVRFLWGSEGSPVEAQSCWLRVSHPSAGAGFGHVALPRTGEEVVVDFLGGNPDRPIVTGRVYNSEHRHAYPLPQHRTRSLYRSHSIGPIGSYPGAEGSVSGPGFNEMRFEDKGGSEEVYLRAQRNRLAEVLLDDEARIRRDRKTRVGRNRDTHIRGDETTSVERGNYRVSVGMGRATIQAAQSITLQVGANKLVIDQTGIQLVSGLSSIRMTPVNIMTKAVTLSSQGQAMQMIGGGVVVVKGSAATTVGPVALVVGVVAPPL